jgi:hypothetical protein
MIPSLGPVDMVMLMIFGMMFATVAVFAAYCVWKLFHGSR